MENLKNAVHKMSEELYSSANTQDYKETNNYNGSQDSFKNNGEDDVIDADFTTK
jgi:hypothetical protein